MATTAGFLPMIKCSNCNHDVEISAMGDHVCAPVTHAPIAPPSPPPSAGYESPDRLTTAMAAKQPGRSGAPPSIDPSIANNAYLQPNIPTPASSIGSHLASPQAASAPRSPMPQSPYEPSPSPDGSVIDLDSVFTFPMPGNRASTRVSVSGLNAPSTKSVSSASSQGLGLDLVPENIQLPPSPLPPLQDSAEAGHHRVDSSASHSSYRTSLASTRYGGSTARSSTNSFSRGLRTFVDDHKHPVPPAPLRTPNRATFSRDSNISASSFYPSDQEDSYSGFDFGLSNEPTSTPLHDLPEEQTPVEGPEISQQESFPFPPPQNRLHPQDAETGTDAPRKASDATSEGAFSITSFARALGLEEQDPKEGHSISSESMPSESEAGSGSSMSSLPSDGSFNRPKMSDPLNLGPLVEELPARTRQTIVELPGRVRYTMEEVPAIPAAFFTPDSPTDPAIGQGSLSLIREKAEAPASSPLKEKSEDHALPEAQAHEQPEQPEQPEASKEIQEYQANSSAEWKTRQPDAFPIPRPPTRSATRSKGKCKGCGETITGKSISSSDGRLTGRYHRGCFVCFECNSPFQSTDFYVLNNHPFCAQHYHERNGSLCSTCHSGIEGQYLETVERNHNRPERRRFHPDCLQCRTCNVLLEGDYFEWNGGIYCERDARRAAASYYPPPAGRRRPTIGSSPLAPPRGGYPPGPAYGPPPGQGLRPGPRYPPGPPSPMRFPERRTTRLMMV